MITQIKKIVKFFLTDSEVKTWNNFENILLKMKYELEGTKSEYYEDIKLIQECMENIKNNILLDEIEQAETPIFSNNFELSENLQNSENSAGALTIGSARFPVYHAASYLSRVFCKKFCKNIFPKMLDILV